MKNPEKYFQAGKTYVENDPYRAPEITAVFKVVWVGSHPGHPEDTFLAMGFKTEAFPGTEWDLYLNSITQQQLDDEGHNFSEEWAEGIWTEFEENGKKFGCWSINPDTAAPGKFSLKDQKKPQNQKECSNG